MNFPRPIRTPWRDFPHVVIHAEERKVKTHQLYAAAKAGDVRAAEGLVNEMVDLSATLRIRALSMADEPVIVPVHAVEADGVNAIPAALAEKIREILGWNVWKAVIQINSVGHTGADGYTRLAFPALFGGAVPRRPVLMADDFIGQGGTLANLRGYLEAHGALVIGATTLTGKAFSARLQLQETTLNQLRVRHGGHLEQWWIDTFGYRFERLTESEARYIARADDAHAVSARIAQARFGRDPRVS